jgi:hypothetical protein
MPSKIREETKVGADEIKIDRPSVAAVKSAALEDSLLPIGEPGAGKARSSAQPRESCGGKFAHLRGYCEVEIADGR